MELRNNKEVAALDMWGRRQTRMKVTQLSATEKTDENKKRKGERKAQRERNGRIPRCLPYLSKNARLVQLKAKENA